MKHILKHWEHLALLPHSEPTHHTPVWCCRAKSDSQIILWSFPFHLLAESCCEEGAAAQHCCGFGMCHVQPAWGQGKGSPRQGQLLAQPSAMCGAGTAVPSSPLSQAEHFGFHSHAKQQLQLPWVCPQWGQSPAWYGGDSCWKNALWGCLAVRLRALWASPAHGQPWARWSQLSQVKAAGSRLWEDPCPLWQWHQGVLLLLFSSPHIHSGFDTISVAKESCAGDWQLSGVMCQTPIPTPEQKTRGEAEELRCSSPCPAGVGLSGVQFLSQKVLMMLHFFPPGYCENVGQCGMGRGTGSAHMLSSVSQPSSEAQSRQTPAHISHNKGQFGFIMKHSPLFSDWWLLQFFFFHIRYPSNVISFSRLFSSFNNKAGTEKQHYHYPFL